MKIRFTKLPTTAGTIKVSLDGGQSFTDYNIADIHESGITLSDDQDYDKIQIQAPANVLKNLNVVSSVKVDDGSGSSDVDLSDYVKKEHIYCSHYDGSGGFDIAFGSNYYFSTDFYVDLGSGSMQNIAGTIPYSSLGSVIDYGSGAEYNINYDDNSYRPIKRSTFDIYNNDGYLGDDGNIHINNSNEIIYSSDYTREGDYIFVNNGDNYVLTINYGSGSNDTLYVNRDIGSSNADNIFFGYSMSVNDSYPYPYFTIRDSTGKEYLPQDMIEKVFNNKQIYYGADGGQKYIPLNLELEL